MDVDERFFLLLTQEQIILMIGILAELYFDEPEVRALLRTISSQIDTSLISGGTIH